ncbi:MAG: Omp28 family outer membrane lipoprotein [Bacteroidales bacterium]|nr:Omp28 family outer membrane lipoprotein [Bacteroidales bacterium]
MKRLINIALLLAFAFVFQACEKVEPPYKTGIDCEAGNRKVLIEDYTGHGCVNCPGAAVTAHELQQLCEDRIIIMAVHAGYFANTETFGPEYTYDFNTEAGTEWNNFYGIIGNPKGMVNRIDGGVGVVTVPDKWGEKVVAQLEVPADIELSVSTSFNQDEKQLTTTVSGHFISAVSGKFNLVVCVTENNIVEPQKNNDAELGDVPDWLDYVHMHVLRIGINGAWGDEIGSGDVPKGLDFSKTYTQDFNNRDWVPENCHVVAFVYQDSDKSILQVEEAAVVE